jgi:hypothetical protein
MLSYASVVQELDIHSQQRSAMNYQEQDPKAMIVSGKVTSFQCRANFPRLKVY